LPHVPRLHHLTPHRPTARRHVHLRGSHCQGNFCAKSTPGARAPPEEVCKPDSVPPPRKRGQQPFVWSPGCPGDRATDPRGAGGPPAPGPEAGSPSYTVLLRVGFTERPPSRADRGGFSLPRSPFPRARGPGGSVLCGTFPRPPGAAVDGHPALWSPDFPPAFRRAAARPPPARGARRRLLLPGLLALWLPEEHALAVGAKDQLLVALDLVVQLRRDVHVAALARAAAHRDHGDAA